MNVLITGANRGIGLGFVRHYLDQGCAVWAGYRHDAGGLADLAGEHLHPVRLDIMADLPLAELPARIDLLINNAGIYGPHAQSLDAVAPEDMMQVYAVDCVGPLRVVQALKDRVAAARGVIANLSSKMGSSSDNSSGGSYAYRAAKAALVIVSKSMAIDLATAGVRVITLHPGWVRTDMTDHGGLVDVPESVAGMASVIARIGDYEPGALVAFDGRVIPY
jgi:NAD(P)-dependent dehydrogenase (short-subunit alcohol dehydrogenase family)